MGAVACAPAQPQPPRSAAVRPPRLPGQATRARSGVHLRSAERTSRGSDPRGGATTRDQSDATQRSQAAAEGEQTEVLDPGGRSGAGGHASGRHRGQRPAQRGRGGGQREAGHQVALGLLRLLAQSRRVKAVDHDDAGAGLERVDRLGAQLDRAGVVRAVASRGGLDVGAGRGARVALGRQRGADAAVRRATFSGADDAVIVLVGVGSGALALAADVNVLDVGVGAIAELGGEAAPAHLDVGAVTVDGHGRHAGAAGAVQGVERGLVGRTGRGGGGCHHQRERYRRCRERREGAEDHVHGWSLQRRKAPGEDRLGGTPF